MCAQSGSAVHLPASELGARRAHEVSEKGGPAVSPRRLRPAAGWRAWPLDLPFLERAILVNA